MVHAQVAQALIQHPAHVGPPIHAGGQRLRAPGRKLGGHHHRVPIRQIPRSPAQILLAGAALVGNSGVKKVDTQFQGPADNVPGGRLVHCPGVLAGCGVAEAHAPHADAGNGQIGGAQLCVFHVDLLKTAARPAFPVLSQRSAPGGGLLQYVCGWRVCWFIIAARRKKRKCPLSMAGYAQKALRVQRPLPLRQGPLDVSERIRRQSQRLVIISRMVRSVCRMPSLASRPTLAMVLSTPLVTMPSPPLNSWWLRHMW